MPRKLSLWKRKMLRSRNACTELSLEKLVLRTSLTYKLRFRKSALNQKNLFQQYTWISLLSTYMLWECFRLTLLSVFIAGKSMSCFLGDRWIIRVIIKSLISHSYTKEIITFSKCEKTTLFLDWSQTRF